MGYDPNMPTDTCKKTLIHTHAHTHAHAHTETDRFLATHFHLQSIAKIAKVQGLQSIEKKTTDTIKNMYKKAHINPVLLYCEFQV